MKKQSSFPLVTLMFCFTCNLFAQVNQDFTLVNKTGVAISKFFVAPVTDSESWGPNLLGDRILKNGETLEISFNKSKFLDDCAWDMKVNDRKGNSLSWYDIDLCKYNTITLHWDDSKGNGWAEFE
ncbi:MAG: hypothetical protein HY963_01840 [Ignavibacteriales bacterium]|nr:hypothetical protein [Ignavibacteriales bacterium]